MKIITTLICFTALIFSLQSVNAQCTGCTITISTTVSTPQLVLSGTTLCVTSTGNLTGPIVINGGEICNEGTISSTDLGILSGTLTNYATINVGNLGITSGTFDNQGNATVDSLGLLGVNITLTNSGTIISNYFGVTKSGTGSVPVVNNNGLVTAIDLGITDANFNNSDRLLVTNDFGNYNNASTSNTGSMNVGRDFGNDATFYTECMIPVGRDCGNTGTITGPMPTGCGGFSVVGLTGNGGNFATDNSFLDMCDSGNPPGGFDGNTGSLGSNVTFCSCANNCAVITDAEESATTSSIKVYPNPTSGEVSIYLEMEATTSITIRNNLGQLVMSKKNATENFIKLDLSNQPNGIYFLLLETDGQFVTKKLIKN